MCESRKTECYTGNAIAETSHKNSFNIQCFAKVIHAIQHYLCSTTRAPATASLQERLLLWQ
jgi:hypothetical protein